MHEKLAAMALVGLMMCGCSKHEDVTPPRYLTIGMACTTNEESLYPHVWAEKRNPKKVCAVMDTLPTGTFDEWQSMHFGVSIEGGEAAEFSSWYDAEWWLGMQPYPNRSIPRAQTSRANSPVISNPQGTVTITNGDVK